MGPAARLHARSPGMASVGVHGSETPLGSADADRLTQGQRSRAMAAMSQILAERGVAGASVAAVCDGALISRATFTSLFGSPQGCVDALIVDFVDRATVEIQAAASAQDSWIEAVIAGLQALLRLLDREPAVARACLLEPHASQALAMRRWPQLAERVERDAAPARAGASGEGLPARLLAEATLATVIFTLSARLLMAQAPPFSGLLEDLTALVVLPWMGQAAAGSAMRMAGSRQDRAAEPDIPHPSRRRVCCRLRCDARTRTGREARSDTSPRIPAPATSRSPPQWMFRILARSQNCSAALRRRACCASVPAAPAAQTPGASPRRGSAPHARWTGWTRESAEWHPSGLRVAVVRPPPDGRQTLSGA